MQIERSSQWLHKRVPWLPKTGVSRSIVINQPMQPTRAKSKPSPAAFLYTTFCPTNGEQKPMHRQTHEHRRTQTAAQGECRINDEQRKYKKNVN